MCSHLHKCKFSVSCAFIMVGQDFHRVKITNFLFFTPSSDLSQKCHERWVAFDFSSHEQKKKSFFFKIPACDPSSSPSRKHHMDQTCVFWSQWTLHRKTCLQITHEIYNNNNNNNNNKIDWIWSKSFSVVYMKMKCSGRSRCEMSLYHRNMQPLRQGWQAGPQGV